MDVNRNIILHGFNEDGRFNEELQRVNICGIEGRITQIEISRMKVTQAIERTTEIEGDFLLKI